MSAHQQLSLLSRLGVTAQLGQLVVFGQGVLDAESYAEPGMLARLTQIAWAENWLDMLRIQVSFEGLDAYNKPFECLHWVDPATQQPQSSRDAGLYQPIDTFLVPFEVLDLWLQPASPTIVLEN